MTMTQKMTRAEALRRVDELERELEAIRDQVPDDDGQVVIRFQKCDTGRRGTTYIKARLTREQGRGLRAVYDAVEGREMLNRGREVRSPIDTVRWILERVEAQLG